MAKFDLPKIPADQSRSNIFFPLAWPPFRKQEYLPLVTKMTVHLISLKLIVFDTSTKLLELQQNICCSSLNRKHICA